MTQPSGEYPDGAFNLDSLAELAARPQSEWEAQMRGQTSNGFELVLSALFGPLPADLREGIEFTRALVTAIIRQILNLPGQIWDSVEDALAALAGWVADIPIIGDILTIINDTFSAIFGGIDFTGTLPTPAEVWQTVINTLMLPLNLLLGPGSRIELPQLPSVFLGSLTTASPNFLEAFSAMSVPTSDGWSYDSVADAAKVVCDGSTKTLYLSGPVIPVEAGQPLNIAQKVRYSGVTSGAGQTIQFVLETFASDDGSGTATPVVVDGITNPSGTASTVTIGDPDWDPPPGVESVRPVLVVDELVTAGTVFWENRPSLKKGLDSALSGGLPKAIQDRIDDMQATWDKFKGAAGGTVDDIEDALNGAGQAIRDAIANALGHSGTGHTSANILTYLQNIPQTVVSGLPDLNTLTNQIRDILAGLVVTPIDSTVQAIKDWFTGLTGKTANLTTGGLFDAGKLANITGTISQSLVTGLTSSLNALNTFIQNVVDAILSALRGVPIIGGVIADLVSDITGLKSTADTALDTSNQIVEDTNAGWTGGTPTGTPTAVYDTITEIRDAVNGVYTVEVKTTSGTWTNPGGITEFWAICIGSGDAGGRGGATASGIFSYGGGGRDASPSNRVGASGGKYIAQQINPADLTSTVSYTVPAGGTPAGSTGPVIGGAGAPAVFGAYVSSDINTNGSISSLLGFYDANSSGPGVGGLGGNVNTSDAAFKGTDGANTPLAVGGTGGALGGSSGSAGGNASLTGQTRCGGAGGGGGGGNATGTAGGGGAGGFPGGGGGGGGAARSGNTPGLGGNGANGAIVLIYR